MADFFYIDELAGECITHQKLLEDIQLSLDYNPYCISKDYYTVFRTIVLSLVLGEEIILLDEDFSEEELVRLTGLKDFKSANKIVNPKLLEGISNLNDLFRCINQPSINWRVTLFTSGTTGVPKKLTHSFSSITRSVKQSDKHAESIWGFAYNPTHMAGIQVFFQALLNHNCIVRLFRFDREMIFNQIIENCVTHISATPTFYRLLLPADRICSSVIRLTSGGERFDGKTLMLLTKMFPNAKITNVYASTEAGAVFASTGNDFVIKKQYLSLVKIENNELFLHKSLVGKSDYLKDHEEIWYATGDLVEILTENPLTIQFLNRKNETINVGGYKVNPGEVEEAMQAIEGIREVRVFAKKNSLLGSIVMAEVVRLNETMSEANIRAILQNRLQEFKIPRIIRFVDSLKVTRTGKIQRN